MQQTSAYQIVMIDCSKFQGWLRLIDMLTSAELVAPTELDDGDELLLLSLTATNVSIGNLLTFSMKEEGFTKFIYKSQRKEMSPEGRMGVVASLLLKVCVSVKYFC